MKAKMASLTHVPQGSQMALQVADIQGRLSVLENHYATIEKAIEDSPERAMSIPMLRRDIDSLKVELVSDRSINKDDIDRVYHLTEWLIGGIALSVVGLVIHGWTQRDAAKKET